MKIQKMLLTPNKYSRPQTKLAKVTKIAVHYVGNANTTALNNRNFFESLKDQIPDATNKYCLNKDGSFKLWNGEKIKLRWVSSHFIVGLQGEIIQCLPENEISYCTNQANSYTISIETCHPDSTGKFNDATLNSLIELVADLVKRYNLNPDTDIIRHYDVTKKQCPLYYVPTKYQSEALANERWNGFKAAVKNRMGIIPTAQTNTDNAVKDGSFKVRILDAALNIRQYPGIDNKIVGVIADRGIYTITDVSKVGTSTWGRLKSGAGWINVGEKYVIKLEV